MSFVFRDIEDRSVSMSAKPKPAGPQPAQQWSSKVTSGGRVVLPAAARLALGLKDGDPVQVRLDNGELSIVPLSAIVRDIQTR